MMRSLAIFCGANPGNNCLYKDAAELLGNLMARQQITLVYGGGKVGLMGAIADRVLAGGGKAIGVIPQSLVDREVAHTGLSELHVVQTMHERKALMAARADAFVAMPGGFGTFDEICEIITWNQLGIISKPVAFLNVGGYYDPFFDMIDHSVAEGFINPMLRKAIIVEANPEVLLQKLRNAAAASSEDWVDFKRI